MFSIHQEDKYKHLLCYEPIGFILLVSTTKEHLLKDVTVWTPEQSADAAGFALFMKITLIGALISIPMALVGVTTKAEGATNEEAAVQGVVAGHTFIWHGVVGPVAQGTWNTIEAWAEDN